MSSRPSATADAKPAIAMHGDADRPVKLIRALARLQPGQVGEDRGLNGLKELQRRAHDQQHVEHEPGETRGQRAARGARRDDQHAGVHERLLGEHDADHRDGEAGAVAQGHVAGRLLHAAVGGALGARRRRSGPVAAGTLRRMREKASGMTDSEANGATAMPRPTSALAGSDSDRDGEREEKARGRFEEDEAAVEVKALVPGQPAAGEVARRVGQHPDDEDPVQAAGPVEDPMLDRRAQGQGDDQEHGRKAELDRRRNAQRMALQAAGPAVGDRAREQLLDRAVDHRQDHEHDRPGQRDAAVGGGVQGVAGDGQVGEGEDARRGDPDRQDAGAGRVGTAGRRRRGAVGAGSEVSVPPLARGLAPPFGDDALDRHQQHRPRERRADLDHLAVAREQRDEPSSGPVIDMAGGVPELAQ